MKTIHFKNGETLEVGDMLATDLQDALDKGDIVMVNGAINVKGFPSLQKPYTTNEILYIK